MSEENRGNVTVRDVVCFLLGLLLFLVVSFLWTRAYPKDFYTTNEIWDEVQLVGRYNEDHPAFSDTTNVQATLIKDAYGWLQGIMDGYTILDRFSLTVDTDTIQYDLEGKGFYDYLVPIKIHAVRRKDTGNPPALFSTSIDDLNKTKTESSYPEYYAFDGNRIHFSSYPAIDTVFYVWAYRQASTDSVCAWGKKPVLLSAFRHILIFRTLALAKQKEGNEVAYRNITAIAQSMVARMMDLQRLIEGTKDVKVLPQLYEE